MELYTWYRYYKPNGDMVYLKDVVHEKYRDRVMLYKLPPIVGSMVLEKRGRFHFVRDGNKMVLETDFQVMTLKQILKK